MPEVVVVGAFTAEAGKEQDARQALEALVEPTHLEPGCILYALHQGAEDPARLVFIERWASREEFEAHLASDHVARVLERVDELFPAPEITVFDPLPGGERNKGSLAGHAGGV